MSEKEMLAVVAEPPTAPFHEEAVRAEIEAQLGEIAHVKFERDAAALAPLEKTPGWDIGERDFGAQKVATTVQKALRRHHVVPRA